MGQCLCKRDLSPPTITSQITGDEVRQILHDYFKVPHDKIFIADRDYGLYNISDLQRFLEWDSTDRLKYVAEGFDCDDFADVLKGKERLWYGFGSNVMSQSSIEAQNFGKRNAGSTFGTIWGDIRKASEPEKPRYHAVNYFIDDKKQVHLIEPQNDDTFTWVPGSTAYVLMG